MAKKKKVKYATQSVMEHKPVQNNWTSFDNFWCSIKELHGFSDNLKIAIKIFFENKGYMSPDKFDEGLKAFGIKEPT